MTRLSIQTAAFSALLTISGAFSFTGPIYKGCRELSHGLLNLKALPTPEESAKVLSDYMTKAHEDKLKAIATAENKNRAEIEALKKEIKDLKQNKALASVSAPSGGAIVGFTNNKMLTEKLAAYQDFMSSYIVKAQEEKYKAVKAAEASIIKKYEEKLLLRSGSPSQESSDVNSAYSQRSAKIEAAAKAGKSRWADIEVAKSKVAASVGTLPTQGTTAPASPAQQKVAPTSIVDIPPEVVAADHGLRADGGVDGLTLAERVVFGAASKFKSSTPVVQSAVPSLFDLRSARVSAAAKAGKSRWGNMEVAKANSQAIAVMVDPQVVEKADHGLRADGGVSGPSLADRVNLGAQLLKQ